MHACVHTYAWSVRGYFQTFVRWARRQISMNSFFNATRIELRFFCDNPLRRWMRTWINAYIWTALHNQCPQMDIDIIICVWFSWWQKWFNWSFHIISISGQLHFCLPGKVVSMSPGNIDRCGTRHLAFRTVENRKPPGCQQANYHLSLYHHRQYMSVSCINQLWFWMFLVHDSWFGTVPTCHR